MDHSRRQSHATHCSCRGDGLHRNPNSKQRVQAVPGAFLHICPIGMQTPPRLRPHCSSAQQVGITASALGTFSDLSQQLPSLIAYTASGDMQG